MNSINPDLGKLLENLVYIELRRRNKEIYYYKNRNGSETDFYLPLVKEAYQVSYSLQDIDTRAREIKALIKTMDETELEKGYILTYNEEEKIDYAGYLIEVIPVWKWLMKVI